MRNAIAEAFAWLIAQCLRPWRKDIMAAYDAPHAHPKAGRRTA